MKLLFIIALLPVLAFGFLDEVKRRVGSRAKQQFSKNMENDTASIVDEVSIRKLNQKRKEQREARRRRKSRERNSTNYKRTTASSASNCSNDQTAANALDFDRKDLAKIDAYAKRLRVDRNTAIKLIVIQNLDK